MLRLFRSKKLDKKTTNNTTSHNITETPTRTLPQDMWKEIWKNLTLDELFFPANKVMRHLQMAEVFTRKEFLSVTATEAFKKQRRLLQLWADQPPRYVLDNANRWLAILKQYVAEPCVPRINQALGCLIILIINHYCGNEDNSDLFLIYLSKLCLLTIKEDLLYYSVMLCLAKHFRHVEIQQRCLDKIQEILETTTTMRSFNAPYKEEKIYSIIDKLEMVDAMPLFQGLKVDKLIKDPVNPEQAQKILCTIIPYLSKAIAEEVAKQFIQFGISVAQERIKVLPYMSHKDKAEYVDNHLTGLNELDVAASSHSNAILEIFPHLSKQIAEKCINAFLELIKKNGTKENKVIAPLFDVLSKIYHKLSKTQRDAFKKILINLWKKKTTNEKQSTIRHYKILVGLGLVYPALSNEEKEEYIKQLTTVFSSDFINYLEVDMIKMIVKNIGSTHSCLFINSLLSSIAKASNKALMGYPGPHKVTQILQIPISFLNETENKRWLVEFMDLLPAAENGLQNIDVKHLCNILLVIAAMLPTTKISYDEIKSLLSKLKLLLKSNSIIEGQACLGALDIYSTVLRDSYHLLSKQEKQDELGNILVWLNKIVSIRDLIRDSKITLNISVTLNALILSVTGLQTYLTEMIKWLSYDGMLCNIAENVLKQVVPKLILEMQQWYVAQLLSCLQIGNVYYGKKRDIAVKMLVSAISYLKIPTTFPASGQGNYYDTLDLDFFSCLGIKGIDNRRAFTGKFEIVCEYGELLSCFMIRRLSGKKQNEALVLPKEDVIQVVQNVHQDYERKDMVYDFYQLSKKIYISADELFDPAIFISSSGTEIFAKQHQLLRQWTETLPQAVLNNQERWIGILIDYVKSSDVPLINRVFECLVILITLHRNKKNDGDLFKRVLYVLSRLAVNDALLFSSSMLCLAKNLNKKNSQHQCLNQIQKLIDEAPEKLDKNIIKDMPSFQGLCADTLLENISSASDTQYESLFTVSVIIPYLADNKRETVAQQCLLSLESFRKQNANKAEVLEAIAAVFPHLSVKDAVRYLTIQLKYLKESKVDCKNTVKGILAIFPSLTEAKADLCINTFLELLKDDNYNKQRSFIIEALLTLREKLTLSQIHQFRDCLWGLWKSSINSTPLLCTAVGHIYFFLSKEAKQNFTSDFIFKMKCGYFLNDTFGIDAIKTVVECVGVHEVREACYKTLLSIHANDSLKLENFVVEGIKFLISCLYADQKLNYIETLIQTLRTPNMALLKIERTLTIIAAIIPKVELEQAKFVLNILSILEDLLKSEKDMGILAQPLLDTWAILLQYFSSLLDDEQRLYQLSRVLANLQNDKVSKYLYNGESTAMSVRRLISAFNSMEMRFFLQQIFALLSDSSSMACKIVINIFEQTVLDLTQDNLKWFLKESLSRLKSVPEKVQNDYVKVIVLAISCYDLGDSAESWVDFLNLLIGPVVRAESKSGAEPGSKPVFPLPLHVANKLVNHFIIRLLLEEKQLISLEPIIRFLLGFSDKQIAVKELNNQQQDLFLHVSAVDSDEEKASMVLGASFESEQMSQRHKQAISCEWKKRSNGGESSAEETTQQEYPYETEKDPAHSFTYYSG